MRIRRVVVLHGYRATPADHWFGWLREELRGDGITVDIPALTDPVPAGPHAWMASAQRAVGHPDEQTAVVTHSFGCIGALRALDRVPDPWTLGALVVVAGFSAPLPALPELDPFASQAPDLPRTVARTRHRAVFLSDRDTWVPPRLTRELGDQLAAEQILVPGAGHFLAEEGMTRFTALLAHLRGLPRSRG